MQAARYDGLTPLHEAAETGNARLVHAYLALGADKNARNQVGAVPVPWHLQSIFRAIQLDSRHSQQFPALRKQGTCRLKL